MRAGGVAGDAHAAATSAFREGRGGEARGGEPWSGSRTTGAPPAHPPPPHFQFPDRLLNGHLFWKHIAAAHQSIHNTSVRRPASRPEQPAGRQQRSRQTGKPGEPPLQNAKPHHSHEGTMAGTASRTSPIIPDSMQYFSGSQCVWARPCRALCPARATGTARPPPQPAGSQRAHKVRVR